MGSVLLVGTGGALGAMGRYGLSLLPWRGEFPLLTLLTNLLGAVLIGFIAGLAGRGRLNPSAALFWKTGVCGGFTTFSTFSIDTFHLYASGSVMSAALNIILNACLAIAAAGIGYGIFIKREAPRE